MVGGLTFFTALTERESPERRRRQARTSHRPRQASGRSPAAGSQATGGLRGGNALRRASAFDDAEGLPLLQTAVAEPVLHLDLHLVLARIQPVQTQQLGQHHPASRKVLS